MSPRMLTEGPEPVNILYTGDGGTGKTTDLCDMARLGKIWVCNAESGIKARALRDHGIPVENIEVFPDVDAGEVLSFDGLESEWLRIREALHEDPTAYAGCGWDSITEIQQALKDLAVQGSVDRASRAGRDRSRFVVDQDNWREVNEQCRLMIRRFRDLPCHFAATALQRREQDDSSQVVYQPGVTPSLQGDVVLWFDIICVTSTALVDGEEEFRGLFRPHGRYRGKDRDHVMPMHLVDPTFGRVKQYVDRELTVDDDLVMAAARERRKRSAEKTGTTATAA